MDKALEAGAVEAKQRTVYFAPTARRHFLTLNAAAKREAGARIEEKYPSESSGTEYGGFHWSQDDHLRKVRDRIARRLIRQFRARAIISTLPATDTSGLVERLRLIGYEATEEAADRIEALERENAAERENARHWCGEINAIGAMLGIGAPDAGEVPAAVQALLARAEKAEARLAEAEAEIVRYREELGNIANSWTGHTYDDAKNAVEIMKDIAKEVLNADSYLEGRK